MTAKNGGPAAPRLPMLPFQNVLLLVLKNIDQCVSD